MHAAWRTALITGALALAAACGQWPGANPTGPSATTGGTPTPTPMPTPNQGATVAFNQDIQPIFASDCVMCHSQLRTYAGTMVVVQPGNPNSPLVVFTRSTGAMYRYLTGDRASKSNLIYQWVVNNNAAQSR